jgi:hypothetical protein
MNTKLFALVAAMSIVVPALAQDNFPDTPENHWAYEAIENLKREGILVGYPAGTYKGARATSRYELAVALNAAYQRLKNLTDGLANQITEVRNELSKMGPDAALSKRLMDIEAQLKGMSGLKDDMDAMKKMTTEFQSELAALGVDVEQMQKDMAEMRAMMTQKQSVTIGGDANIWTIAGAADDANKLVFDQAGRQLGIDDQGTPRSSILSDLNIYHEIALSLKGGQDGGFKWDGTIVNTNMFAGEEMVVRVSGNQSDPFTFQPYFENASDTYIQRLAIDLSGVLPFSPSVGRIGLQTVNPYLYRRSDVTPTFENARWDNGDWLMDGAIVRVGVGTGEVRLFGGRHSGLKTNNGLDIQPRRVVVPTLLGDTKRGPGPIASETSEMVGSTFGVDAVIPIGPNGNVNLGFLQHFVDRENSDFVPSGSADRLEVLGGGLSYSFSDNLKFNSGVAVSTPRKGGKDLGTSGSRKRNKAYFFDLDYSQEKWSLGLGFRRIDQEFNSLGDWGRQGIAYNERAITDLELRGQYAFTDKLSLQFKGRQGYDLISFNGEMPRYTNVDSKLGFEISDSWMTYLGFEQYEKDFRSDNEKERYQWISLGIRTKASSNTLVHLVYQRMSGKVPTFFASPSYRGNIVAAQVSVRF